MFSSPITLRQWQPALAALLLGVIGSAAAEVWPWRPFAPVNRAPVPGNVAPGGAIDAFLKEKLAESHLNYRPAAPRDALLRRVYLDLIGLAPTPEERASYLADSSPEAYAQLVERLLNDPRHAERWARHWMDIWRYSDWAGWADGKQIRDSQPHIWRWRDWIVESLAADVGYDRMVTDMLAADERAPGDVAALRATGFLVRNYKMLSREQWLQDTVKHTSLAFLGLTVGCAQCHDHKTDPLPQTEYYAMRAIFEPHQVRIDHVPGQADTTIDGLARAFDNDPAVPTYFLPHGDERAPDKDRVIAPGVPACLGGALTATPVALPPEAVAPQRRELVREAMPKGGTIMIFIAPSLRSNVWRILVKKIHRSGSKPPRRACLCSARRHGGPRRPPSPPPRLHMPRPCRKTPPAPWNRPKNWRRPGRNSPPPRPPAPNHSLPPTFLARSRPIRRRAADGASPSPSG